MKKLNKPIKNLYSSTNSKNKDERSKYYRLKIWKKIREEIFSENPFCQMCMKENPNSLNLGVDIHHIISFMSVDSDVERYRLFTDKKNLLCLCKYHHGLIHGGKNKY